MNRFKFNNGNGALVCNDCNRIVESPITKKKAYLNRFNQCPHCLNLYSLIILVDRLNKIGIDITYISNFPWIYLDTINKKKVKETLDSEHGYTIGYLPIKPDEKFVFTDISEIFKLIRKYI